MKNNFHNRRIMLLENNKEDIIKKLTDILESPLGLAKTLVTTSFTQPESKGLMQFKESLDSIKKLAAGLGSAEQKVNDKIANYSLYLFAFQQFFHSSYRARQGNVLEAIISDVLRNSNATVYPRKNHKDILKNNLGIDLGTRHDIDIFSSINSKYLIVQVRSRDDTGGTTAKGSLVELLRNILREINVISSPILYVVYVWEPLDSNQKLSLIKKMIGELHNLIDIPNLLINLDNCVPITIKKNIIFQLAYGPEQFSEILTNYTQTETIRSLFQETLKLAMEWDDLWLSYAIASFELERSIIKGESNFKILEEKLEKNKINITNNDLSNYVESSKKYALTIISNWTEDTLPVSSPSDQINYIRDLILLKMIHQKIKQNVNYTLF